MRLASYRANGKESFGIVVKSRHGDGIVDLRERLDLPDLKSLLAQGIEKAQAWSGEPPDHLLTEVLLLPPITNPQHIICVGLNTRSHAKEAEEFFKMKIDDPTHPRLFVRSPMSHVGHGQNIVTPRVSNSLDFEGEIAFVIGRAGRYIRKADALAHVAGVACYNDGSVREFQRHSDQVGPAKNFVASGAFGPWMTTLDEAGPVSELVMETRINGELRQRLTMDDLFFDISSLIEYISQPWHLQPGDVISIGSPAGVGAIAGKYLQAGDVVNITIPTVGSLINKVVAE